MPNESFAKLAQMRKCIDTPRPDQAVYDECISIAGWIFAEAREPSACRVRGWLEGAPIGETRLLFARGDVSEFLSLPRDFPVAFRFLTRALQPNEASREATIEVTASWDGDAAEYSIGKDLSVWCLLASRNGVSGRWFSRCKAWCYTAKIFMALARRCWSPAPRCCALSSIISRLEVRSSMSDAEPGAYASGLAAARKFPPPRRAP